MGKQLKRLKTSKSLFAVSSEINANAEIEEADDDSDGDEDAQLSQFYDELLPPYRKGNSQVNCIMAITLVQK